MRTLFAQKTIWIFWIFLDSSKHRIAPGCQKRIDLTLKISCICLGQSAEIILDVVAAT